MNFKTEVGSVHYNQAMGKGRWMRSILNISILLAVEAWMVMGHGRLINPPSRGSMARFGFNNPVEDDDNGLSCGGYYVQWEMNGGKCGVCGDRYDGPRKHEAGGLYANGIIVRHYRQGETITVEVELTSNHLGYFQFRLCPNNNPDVAVTQSCLDRYLLKQPDGSTRYQVSGDMHGVLSINLVLPSDVTCTQCVVQWKYNVGNSERCEEVGGRRNCCLGCGPQEQFYACADVDITSASGFIGSYTPYLNQGQQFIFNSPDPLNPGQQLPGGTNSPPDNSISSDNNACRSPISEAMTDFCRQHCSTGFCSQIYCSKECFLS